MEYIASLSYGKDSIYMLEVIKQHNMPLDRIVHVEIMATPTIHADLPPMVEFKKKADAIIKERYGIEVEHLHAPKSYEEYFYMERSKMAKPENQGKIYGFPMVRGAWCNSRLKVSVLNKLNSGKNVIQYIGIAVEEVNRYHTLSDKKVSPLVEHGVTEQECYDWCKENDLLSPIYEKSRRGGCWFCHNQSLRQLKILRTDYPEYWELMIKWDKDSPVSFKPDGKTVHDLEERFTEEEKQLTLF